MTRSRVTQARSAMYKGARVLGDAQAASRGPGEYARRVVRRRVYAGTFGTTARVLRRLRLFR